MRVGQVRCHILQMRNLHMSGAALGLFDIERQRRAQRPKYRLAVRGCKIARAGIEIGAVHRQALPGVPPIDKRIPLQLPL